jgi:hypothetical protein
VLAEATPTAIMYEGSCPRPYTARCPTRSMPARNPEARS